MNSFVHIQKSVIDEAIQQKPQVGKRTLSPLKEITAAAKVPLNLLEDSEIVTMADVHQKAADL